MQYMYGGSVKRRMSGYSGCNQRYNCKYCNPYRMRGIRKIGMDTL